MISSDELIKWIDFALAKKAPHVIPRFGGNAELMDCFSVSILLPEGRYLIESRSDNWLSCLYWPQEALAEDPVVKDLSVMRAWQGSPEIYQFLGTFEAKWISWVDFAFDQRFRTFRARVAFEKFKRKAFSAYYARTKLVSTERMTVLDAVFQEQMASGSSATYLQIMMRIHGPEYFLHPARSAATSRVQMLLSGLVETRELQVSRQIDYSITGQGIAALELYEEQERKHQEVIGIQKKMMWLTAILLLSAIVQAGLLKFPALVCVKAWPWESATVDRCGPSK